MERYRVDDADDPNAGFDLGDEGDDDEDVTAEADEDMA